MKLLLKEDVEGLGDCGDEVTVKDGYGRNFLIPNGKAILATPRNVKQFNHQKSIVQARLKKVVAAAQGRAGEISQVTCVITKKAGEQGKLFGSVTTQEIVEALRSKGVEIDRRKIQMKEAIKSLGEFQIPIKLHQDVTAEIKVIVVAAVEVKKEKEAGTEEAEKTETAPESESADEDKAPEEA